MTVADVTGAGGAVEADESARTWTVEPRAMQLPSKVTVEPTCRTRRHSSARH